MALGTRLAALAQRVAAEFKTMRATDLGGVKIQRITMAQYQALTYKDPNKLYFLSVPATPYFVDNFTRTASATSLGTTSTGGYTWVPINATGVFGITNNQAYNSQGSVGVEMGTVVDDGQSDGVISTTLGAVGTSYTTGGIIFRFVDSSNYLYATTDGGLFKVVAGTKSSIGSAAISSAAGSVLSVTLAGSSIIVKYNGSIIVKATDTFNQTATKHGLRSSSPNSGMTWSAISHTNF